LVDRVLGRRAEDLLAAADLADRECLMLATAIAEAPLATPAAALKP
jgi:hypothetical protein